MRGGLYQLLIVTGRFAQQNCSLQLTRFPMHFSRPLPLQRLPLNPSRSLTKSHCQQIVPSGLIAWIRAPSVAIPFRITSHPPLSTN